MTGTQATILRRLQESPATADELALLMYGENDEFTRSNIHAIIHRLRKRGIGIELVDSGSRMEPRYYRLGVNPICPYCKGTGRLNSGDLGTNAKSGN